MERIAYVIQALYLAAMPRVRSQRVLSVIFAALSALTAACSSEGKPNEQEAPNILWIYAEDLSQDLGCYGNEAVHTPVLDGLAASGVRFTNVFTTAGVCTPSRTALATGMYQTSIGAHHMRYPDELLPQLAPGVQTVFQLFRQNGYVTANIKDFPGTGKTDWSFQARAKDHFNFFSWKELASQSKPFLAQLSIKNTHRPFAGKDSDQIDRKKINIPPYYPDHAVSQDDFANYYADIQELDLRIGAVLDSLKKFSFDKNTIVVFLSDHGRPMPRGKTWLYDSGIKIPVILYIPEGLRTPEGYQPGAVNDQLISSIDLVATTLSFADIDKPAYMQGRIFLGKDKEPERAFIYSAADRTGEVFFKSRCIRTDQFKYIRNYNRDLSVTSAATAYRKAHIPVYHLIEIMGQNGTLTDHQEKLLQPLAYEELYDIQNDPMELNNLAGNPEHKDDLAGMSAAMNEYLAEIKDLGLAEDSDALKEAFERYGRTSAERYREKMTALRQQVSKAVNDGTAF